MRISVKEESLKGVKWTTLSRVFTQITTFAIGVVLARLLSAEDYGLVAMVTVFKSLSDAFVDCGLSTALIRKPERTEADKATVFYFNILMGITVYVIMYIVSPYIAEFYEEPILVPLTRVLCLTIPLGSVGGVTSAILSYDLRFKDSAIINIISSIASGLIGIASAYLGLGVWSLAIQGIVYTLLSTLLKLVIVKWWPSARFSGESFKEFFQFGNKLLLSNLLHRIYSQMTPLIVGKFYTSSDLGYYSRANGYSELPTNIFMSVINTVMFPVLSQLQDDKARLGDVYRKYLKMSAMIIFFVMFTLVALAEPAVGFLVSDKWLPCVPYLRILCFAYMFDFICSINLSLLQVIGRSDLFLRLEIIKKALSLTMLFISARYGITAMCVSSVVYTQLAIAINTYYTGKIFKFGYWEQIKDYLPYFIFALIISIPTYLLTLLPISYLLKLLISGPLAIALFIILMRIRGDQTYAMLEDMIKSQICRSGSL